MRRAVIGCALGLGLVLGSALSAQAGETTGNGKDAQGAIQAHSVCAFSGRDQPDSVENNPKGFDDDFFTGGHVQSYGQYVRAGAKDQFPSPGVACRGNAPASAG
jgi:hypothetical protein